MNSDSTSLLPKRDVVEYMLVGKQLEPKVLCEKITITIIQA